MRVIDHICNIPFIKDYLDHFHINKIDMETAFRILKSRIKCRRHGHSYSTCSRIGNSYVSVCGCCGKREVFSLMNNNRLFRD